MTHLYGPGEDRSAVARAASAPAGLEATTLVSPRTIAEACALFGRAIDEGKAAVLLAGGTDWIVDRHLADVSRSRHVDVVVDLTSVSELCAIELVREGEGARLVLGAGVTYWALRTDPRVAAAIPMLARMAKDVGAVQIQTRGTLGGNLASASPAADGVPALMALGASLTIASARGERRVPIEAFFTGYRKTVLEPGEILTRIDLPVPPAGAEVAWRKVGTRLAQAISKVALASVVVTATDRGKIAAARFGMASVAPTTVALPNVSRLVVGQVAASLQRAAVDAAVLADIAPIDDVRSTRDYRAHVAKTLVWRALGR